MGFRNRGMLIGALIAAAGTFGGMSGVNSISGVNVSAQSGGNADRTTPIGQRSMVDNAVRGLSRGLGNYRAQRHSYGSGRAMSCAEQKRRSIKARNVRKNKRAHGMRSA